MTKDDSDLTMDPLYCSDRTYFNEHRVTNVNDLTTSEWETALLLYNRRMPLTTIEKYLFNSFWYNYL